MPREIDPQSLEIISGRSGLKDTADLLSNTLETMKFKMQQKEAVQIGMLRAQEYKQNADQMLEFQKQAHVRDLTNQLAEKQKRAELDNFDYNQEVAKTQTEQQLAIGSTQAWKAVRDQILSTTTPDSLDSILEQNRNLMPAEVYSSLKGSDPRNPNWTTKINRIIGDADFYQRLSLEKLKGELAGKASGSKPTMSTGGEQLNEYVKGQLNRYGDPETTAGIASLADSIVKEQINAGGNPLPPTIIAQKLTSLINANPTRYIADKPRFGTGNSLDIITLRADALGETPAYEQLGVTKDKWDALKSRNPSYSEQELLQYIVDSKGR